VEEGKEMKLKIGHFARMCQVSVSTLRYYDEVGLLKPAHVDRWTSYRHYDLDQVRTLNRILALRDLGLSLDQIRQALGDEMPAEQMRSMLQSKQAELAQQARELQERLVRVEARIEQIEKEGKMSDYDVVVKKVEPIRGVILHETIRSADVKSADASSDGAYTHLIDELVDYVRSHGLTPADVTGPVLDLWYDAPDDLPEEMRVGVMIPTNKVIPGNDRIQYIELPGVEEMVSVVHRGPFATTGQAYVAALRWIDQNGYRLDGPNRGIYLQYERGGDPGEYITELQFPVTKN
jgi:DNA-binding transcriptional MerR regulator